MTDARFPERWLTDRRVLHLSDSAFRGFVNGLAFSVSNRTEGVIEPEDLPLIPSWTPGSEKELAESELWVGLDYGWQIDGFAITQTTRKQLVALDQERIKARDKKRIQREEAKRRREEKAGQTTVPRDVSGDKGTGTTGGTFQARTGQDRTSSYPVPPEVTNNVSSPSSSKAGVVTKSGTSPGAGAKSKRRSPTRTQIPDDWQPPSDARKRMRDQYPHLDLSAEREAFINHHQAHGNGMADWTKAFWTWLGNTRKFGSNGGTVNGHPVLATNDQKSLDWMALGRQFDEQQRKELT